MFIDVNIPMRLLILIILFTSNLHANEFSVSEVVHNHQKLNNLVEKTLRAVDIQNRSQAQEYATRAVDGLSIQKHIKNNKLYGELVYRFSKRPDAITEFLSAFIAKTKILGFFGMLVASLYFSSLLGEMKFYLKPFGFARVFYSVFCFSLVNGVRLTSTVYIFKDHFKASSSIFLQSVTYLSADYPVLFEMSHLTHNILSTAISY